MCLEFFNAKHSPPICVGKGQENEVVAKFTVLNTFPQLFFVSFLNAFLTLKTNEFCFVKNPRGQLVPLLGFKDT
jgi:hypothetical protein